MGRRLNYNEHFDWSENSSSKKPWNRQYWNQDFLDNEIERIKKAKNWKNNLRKIEDGEEVGSIELFSHPVENTYNGWKKPIVEEVGEYVLKVLSPLRNDNQMPVCALFPADNVPEDFSYIKLEKGHKKILFNEKISRPHYFVVVEDYSYLSPDERFLVVDVDHEEGLLKDILERNMGYNSTTAMSMEAPTIGSPQSSSLGGIGMTSFDENSEAINDLFEAIQNSVPFEQRKGIKPPKSAIKGKKVNAIGSNEQAIRYKVAEKVVGPSSFQFSSRVGDSYGVVSSEIKNRVKSESEYSYMTSMDSRRAGRDQLARIRNRFVDNEVKIADPTRQGELESHVEDLASDIGNFENIKINTVYSKQFQPSTNHIDRDKWKKRFKKIWETYANRLGMDYKSGVILSASADKSVDNAINVAQSIARTQGKDKITDDMMDDYYQMFQDEADRFADHPVLKEAKEEKEDIRREDVLNALRQLLTGQGLTKDEIWSYVKSENLFKDREDFEGKLGRLLRDGYIFEEDEDQYRWA